VTSRYGNYVEESIITLVGVFQKWLNLFLISAKY